jgi:hypothetical protein
MVELRVLVRHFVLTATFIGLVAGCSARDSGSPAGVAFTADIQGIGNQIAASAKYPATALEMTSSSV